MKQLTVLMIIVLFIFLISNFVRKSIYLTKVVSSVDGRAYLVRKLADKQGAADRLATLAQNIKRVIQQCAAKPNDAEAVKRLESNFDSDTIIEHMPGNTYVSHSVNKGKELSICVRDKGSNAFIDPNTVMFVALHELAHVMSVSTGHTPEFWANMKYLLECGSEIGVYQPVDYSKTPVMFCGMEINSTPLDFGKSSE
jgi:hypothetical protein